MKKGIESNTNAENREDNVAIRALLSEAVHPVIRARLVERLFQRMEDRELAEQFREAGIKPPDDAEDERLMSLSEEEFDAEMNKLGVEAISKEDEQKFMDKILADLDRYMPE